jgi:hypothetical protein
MAFGDFNADGKVDVFKREDNGKWYVHYMNAANPSFWNYIGASTDCTMSNMIFADFNGDDKTDIYYRDENGNWYVHYVGVESSSTSTNRVKLGQSTSSNFGNMAFGDFNGDKKTDVFKRDSEGNWYVHYINASNPSFWNLIGSSTTATMSNMAFADFNGDGKTDVFRRDSDGRWYVQYTDSTSGWISLGTSTSCGSINNMRFADFNSDSKADVFCLRFNKITEPDTVVEDNCPGANSLKCSGLHGRFTCCDSSTSQCCFGRCAPKNGACE